MSRFLCKYQIDCYKRGVLVLLKGRLSYNNLTSSDLKLAASSTDHKKGLVLNTERGEKKIQRTGEERNWEALCKIETTRKQMYSLLSRKIFSVIIPLCMYSKRQHDTCWYFSYHQYSWLNMLPIGENTLLQRCNM